MEILKRLICALLVVFLCSNFRIAAQESIGNDVFIKLLNYWNCKYTEAYLIEKCKDGKSPQSCKNAIFDLSKCTSLDNSLNIDKLTNLLSRNSWNTVANKLSKNYYNQRISKWKENMNHDQIIDVLILKESDYQGFNDLNAQYILMETTKQLIDDFSKKFTNGRSEGNDKKTPTIQSDINKQNASVTSGRTNTTKPTKENREIIWKIILVLFGLAAITVAWIQYRDTINKNVILIFSFLSISVLFIFLLLYYWSGVLMASIFLFLVLIVLVFKNKTLINNISKKVKSTHFNKSKNKPSKKSETQTNDVGDKQNTEKKSLLQEKISKLEGEIVELKKHDIRKYIIEFKNGKGNIDILIKLVEIARKKYPVFSNYIQSLQIEKPQKEITPKIVELKFNTPNTNANIFANTPNTASILFADAINNGVFYNVCDMPGDLSVYELKPSGSRATFEIYAMAEKRVVARPGNLDGCDAEIVQGGTKLQTVTPGVAHETGGKWFVEKPLKVRIE